MDWNFSDDRPIYAQIVEQVKLFVLSGHWKPGERLPSVRDLAAEAGVNPNTMQKALTELERQEILYSQRTSGRFITEDKAMIQDVKNDFAFRQMKEFLSGMARIGYDKEQVLALLAGYDWKEEGEKKN